MSIERSLPDPPAPCSLELTQPQPESAPLFASADLGADRHLEGLGGWLILTGIGLVVALLRILYMLFGTDVPVLTAARFAAVRQRYPLLHGLVAFEAVTNVVLLLLVAWLLYLFFSKRRSFPTIMILYMVFSNAVMIADVLAAHAILPSVSHVSGDFNLARSIIAAALWIPYFLRSRRVKVTFVH